MPKEDKKSKRTGAAYIAEAFRDYGVTHVFFVPEIMPGAMKEMNSIGVTPVSAHSEKAAAYMADGYARASRRPGICCAQAIGASNLAAGVRDAYLSCTPVIAITGAQSPAYRYRRAYQEVAGLAQFEPLTKFNVAVDTVERIPDLLNQAFRSATSGCPGPVHLQLADGDLGEIVDGELEATVCIARTFSIYPPIRSPADPAAVKEVARLLKNAERPVMIAGGGVRSSGAQPEIAKLAELLSIPVATSLNGKGTVNDSHPLSIGVAGTYSPPYTNRIICEADLVFFVGSLTGGLVTANWKVPPHGTRVIQLDIDPSGLGRNYVNTASLCGDAKLVLEQLIESIHLPRNNKSWLARVGELKAEYRKDMDECARSSDVPIRPQRLMAEVSRHLAPNATLVCDTGHSGAWAAQYLDITSPEQTFIRAAGSLGWGFPASLGAKCACPERPVFCFTGDAGFLYHMTELETAVRYGINTVTVVNNNSAFSQERDLWDDEPACDRVWRFRTVDYVKVAESFGAVGYKVEHPDQIGETLEKAMCAGQPVVIDVVSDPFEMAAFGWTGN